VDVPGFVFGDSMVWDYRSPRLVAQNEQTATIAHPDCVQKIVIAINIKFSKEDGAIWNFPVTDTGEGIVLEFLDNFLMFTGVEPQFRASGLSPPTKVSLRSSQLGTIPYSPK